MRFEPGKLGVGRSARTRDLRGDESVETTEISTHVMAKPGLEAPSPLDAG